MKQVGYLIGLVALGSCALIPGLGDPEPAVFPVAPDAPAKWAAAGVSGELPATDWLSQFEDQTMLALVEEALSANPNLRAQFFAVEASRQQARSVYGRSLPSISLDASATGTSTYIESIDDRVDGQLYGLGPQLSWEADLWGRIAASIDAAEADFAAAEADLAAAELSTAANTAIAWISLNEALAQERVAVETFEARQTALTLTERRFSRGLSSALDVRTARTTLASAEASIALQRQFSGEASRRLEVLLGRYPSAELDAPADIKTLDPIAPASSPILVLARRPDIAAAEARVVAAGLRVEQARFAMLPSLRFTGSALTSEDRLSDAVDPSRVAANLIAGLSAPVFNGGALRADRDAAMAQALGAVENYTSSTLTAWREVEDAIAADTFLALQEEALVRALEEARLAEDLATRQYTNGLVSIFNLIDSQTQRLVSEGNLIATKSARATNRVNYHLALGGGLPVSDAAKPDYLRSNSPEEAVLP
ncbi:MAG: efflux transporter outer membrane subunit [Pseudomonadota bacterium]